MATVFVFYAWLSLARAQPGALPSREEALAMIFPGATWKAERVFLTEEQRRQAGKIAGGDIPTALLARYLVFKDGVPWGRAYVDTHIVRTKKESLLICLDERGYVKRVEVTAFLEPTEYQASPKWYGQFEGRPLSDELSLQRAIRPIAGATLTAAAANGAVRRILAIDGVLQERTSGGGHP
ncbi:MAG: FMN-binding protein [Acidobacteriota bacterium]